MSHFLHPPFRIVNTYYINSSPPKQISYNLSARGHGLTLSATPSEFMRKNFLYRMWTRVVYIADILLFTLCLYVDYAFVIVVIKESTTTTTTLMATYISIFYRFRDIA